jgi:outer membrane protein assembly factor BamB
LGYSGIGDGFIFALISAGGDPPENTANSAGGDIERSELLGYAGDSRTDVDGTTFVDGAGDGLLPPKVGLEFDTRTNYDSSFESNLAYCNPPGPPPAVLVENTRNDPLTGDPPSPEHAVQSVFWGNTTLSIPCRPNGNDATYDDNRHEAEGPTEKWTFTDPPTATVQSSPAIGPDGTIYVGSNDGHLYAVDPDTGTERWRFPSSGNVGDIRSSPAIAADGTIYVGSGDQGIGSDGRVFALNPADREANQPFPSANEWEFSPPGVDNDVDSSPAIDASGNIYIGSDNGFLYAIDENSNELWNFPTVEQVESRPAVSESRQTVYVEAESRFLYAIDITNGLERWRLEDAFGSISDDDELESSPTVGADGSVNQGMIYVGSKDGNLYAVNHNERMADPLGMDFPGPEPDSEWSFPTGAAVRSTPALDPNDGTIYVGSDSGRLFAINPNGSEKWRFPNLGAIGAIRTAPIIDSNGTIYFGSDDGRLYAINADGTERWRFPVQSEPPIGEVRSSPAIGSDDSIYFGSNDNKLNAVTPFAVPRNFRDNSVEPKKLVLANDFGLISNNWLEEGPWAIRMEITRTPSSEGPGIEGTYTLKTWVEKCDGDCSVFTDGLFRDTRVVYNVAAREPKLEQTVKLSDTDHEKFDRFLFGFTTAAQTGDDQQAIIRDFELTFSRSGDPVVTVD